MTRETLKAFLSSGSTRYDRGNSYEPRIMPVTLERYLADRGDAQPSQRERLYRHRGRRMRPLGGTHLAHI
jgi:hypothetical protein